MYPCIYLPGMYLCIYLSTYLSTRYVFNYLSLYPSIHLSIYLPIYLSIYPSTYPSIHLSIYLSIYLSTYLSIQVPTRRQRVKLCGILGTVRTDPAKGTAQPSATFTRRPCNATSSAAPSHRQTLIYITSVYHVL